MRPTRNMEIVFEGTLEARVAAQFIMDSGRAELLEGVMPPIQPPSIGRLEFIAKQEEEKKGNGDNTEYVCDPSVSAEVVRTLARAAIATRTKRPSLSRRVYMGQRLGELLEKTEQMPLKTPPTRAVEIGGMMVVGASDEQLSLLQRREAFVSKFLAEKGWDTASMSVEQLLEVRKQPQWQNPPEIN